MKRKFILKACLFSLPIVLLLGFPVAVLFLSGELQPLPKVIAKQAEGDGEILYGPAFHNPGSAYKLHSTLHRNPKIIALGTSRVMQFRAEFFQKPSEFYNAGGAVTNIFHFREFLAEIPADGNLHTVILGLDQWDLNSKYPVTKSSPYRNFKSQHPIYVLRRSYKPVYAAFWQGRFKVADLFAQSKDRLKLGMHAVVNDSGFRNDGSRDYGVFREASSSSRFDDHLTRIDKGNRKFEYGEEISAARINELRKFLRECIRRKIHVAVFLPPYAHCVCAKMKSLGAKYEYMKNLPQELALLLSEFDLPLFDYTDINSIGSSDEEALDGIHGSEKTYLRILIAMAHGDSRLAKNVDLEYLEELLTNSVSDVAVLNH